MKFDGDPASNAPIHWAVAYQNFYMNCERRGPQAEGDSVFFVNNISFNGHEDGAGAAGNDIAIDIIGIYQKPGAWTESSSTQSGYWGPVYDNDKIPVIDPSIYVAMLRSPRTGMDQTVTASELWRGATRALAMKATRNGHVEGDTVPIAWKRDTQFPVSYLPWVEHDPTDAWRDSMILKVGASQKIDELGYWTLTTNTGANVRDFYDSLRIAQFVDSISSNFGAKHAYPDSLSGDMSPRGGTRYADSDNDGLPNAYEDQCVGSTTGMANNTLTSRGYLTIEEYLNGNASTRVIEWDDNSIGEDGFQIWRDRGSGFTDLVGIVGENVTTFTITDNLIGDVYTVRAYQGLSNSANSNLITATCN